MIQFPVEKAQILKSLNLAPPRGVLLHGPSGSGKTVLALRIAHDSGLCVIHVQIDGLFSTRGGGEHTSQNTSNRLITSLLTELDGLHTKKQGDGVFILAATSHMDAIDTAILRPGRIGVHVEMPVFSDAQRLEFIQERMKMMPINLCNEQIQWIVDNTAGLMVSDLERIFRESALSTLRKDLEATRIDFDSIKSYITA